MDSIVEEKVKRFLTNRFHRQPHECGAICSNITTLARKAGYCLDHRFARSGLAAGPEARIAAAIVAAALGVGGGTATSRYAMQRMIERWLRMTKPMGR